MPREWREENVDDLAGGITDYIDNAAPNESALIENFVITRDRGIQVRNGSDTWNLNALPNNLKALQLFQLEEYIFAYTDDGDCYWTFDDGQSDWVQIRTAADISGDLGSDYFTVKDTGNPLYIIPDEAVQAKNNGPTLFEFEIEITSSDGPGTNSLTITVEENQFQTYRYFKFNLRHYIGNDFEWVWDQTHTDQLQAGVLQFDGEGGFEIYPWIVANDTQVLNLTTHAPITFTTPKDTEVMANANGSQTFTYVYHPIYFFRLKAFFGDTHLGVLSVSKFAGHLYISMFPDDRDYIPNDSDLTSGQPDVWPVQNKRLGLRKIYLLYNPDTQEAIPRLTSAQMPPVDIAPEEGVGGVGDESNLWIYEAYCRHTYEALVEGEPREFIVDGPSTRVEWRSEYDIVEDNFGGGQRNPKVAGRILPRVGYDQELYPLDEMTFNFYRTTKNNTVPYLVNAYPADQARDYQEWEIDFIPSPELRIKWDQGESEEGEQEQADGFINYPFRGLFYTITRLPVGNFNRNTDNTTDETVQENEEAYDATSAFGYFTVPQGPYFFTVSNQVGYYADIFKLKNRVYQSVYGIPHACTAISFLDFDDGITGIKTFRDRAIVFTRESTWRMEGLRGLDGRGSITQRLISDEFGTISNQSVINTNYGLFFFSRTGICYTDGFKCFRVSEQIFETYFDWIEDVEYIRGFYHESDQKVYWAIHWKESTYWLVMDLRYGISKKIPLVLQRGVDWLKMDADDTVAIETVDRFDPNVCLVNERDQRILRHIEGTILVHDKQYTTDYYPPEDQRVPVKFEFISQAHSMGSKKHRKWVANVMMVCKQKEELGISLQPVGINDLTETKQLTGSCFNYGRMDWGDPKQQWRNPDAFWKAFKVVSFRRMFPEGSIRATYKQFGIVSLYVHGPDSETEGGGTYTSTVNGDAYRTYVTIPMSLSDAAAQMEDKTVDDSGQFAVMLPTITGHDWNVIHRVVDNSDSFDVYIEPDTDTNDGQVVNNIEWALGYIRADERIGLDNYTLRYTVIGERTHGAYENSDGASEGDGTEG